MTIIEQRTGRERYALPADTGVTDVWWPFGPAPAVSRWSVKISGEQTDGRLIQVHSRDPRGTAPPLHIHHGADEMIYVINGELTIFVGDERIDVGPGGFVFVPMGTVHAFLVTSEWAETVITCSPAGARGPAGFGIAGFFRDVGVAVVPGEVAPEVTEADPEALARKMAQYGIEQVGPPPTLE
ncbi:MAG TPA: cupin domain-containing protein [Gaiellaceae bacterium]|nr:cupin domain-containing protein [Gaiellaceae bacterium]